MIMNKVRFVGLDVHTETLAVAEADGGVWSANITSGLSVRAGLEFHL